MVIDATIASGRYRGLAEVIKRNGDTILVRFAAFGKVRDVMVCTDDILPIKPEEFNEADRVECPRRPQ